MSMDRSQGKTENSESRSVHQRDAAYRRAAGNVDHLHGDHAA